MSRDTLANPLLVIFGDIVPYPPPLKECHELLECDHRIPCVKLFLFIKKSLFIAVVWKFNFRKIENKNVFFL